ncbi:MAG: SGNH/GDSL hydrolase family protein [Myxococcales bacterium]|nr:SGNH/GDSL hydrolase family protein [Myxococcales bacterium]
MSPADPSTPGLSPERLRPGAWLPASTARSTSGRAGAVIRLALGLSAAALAHFTGHRLLAAIIGGVAIALSGAALASPAARAAIDRSFAALGRGLGRLLAALTLIPLYFTLFPVLRLYAALVGHDPLGLRRSPAPGFWVDRAADARTRRWFATMFAPEPRAPLHPWRARLVGALVVLALAEGGLRLAGYGDPVLYLDDVQVGYLPAPHQSVRRLGGTISINNAGMRAPPFGPRPAGGLRILMLGDSTLYGGSYIDQPDLYARRLHRALQARIGRPIEVLNMGVNGWGPFHELGYVATRGTFDAQLVLVALPLGDVFRPLSRLSMTPYLPASSPPSLALTEVAWHLTWRFREMAFGPPSFEEREARGAAGLEAYAELARRLRATGAEVRFVVLPGRRSAIGEPDVPADGLYDRLADAIAPTPADYPVIEFQRAANPAGLYHDAVHLSRAGHAFYATHLEALIRRTSTWRWFAGEE